MKRVLLDVLPEETVMAITNDGVLSDFEIERSGEASLVGRIYKGTVKNVVPVIKGMFVDIGQDKNAFLRFSDWPDGRSMPTEGMSVIVQVEKDATETKGPLLTGKISIPGRCCVLLTDTSYIGVSKKIKSDETRARLKKMGSELCPEGLGLIIRTLAEGTPEEDVKREITHLVNAWQIIEKRARIEKAPVRLYQESDLVVRCLREYVTPDVDAIVVDDQATMNRILALAEAEHIIDRDRIIYYDGSVPIMEKFGASEEIAKLFEREVPLPSGGSLVIDYTEALTAIDVNTGSFHSRGIPHSEAAYLTNREAVPEIARQIRLRGIGGIIMIDFIDMDKEKQRFEIVDRLKKAVRSDRVRTVVCGMTSLGLVEMTRKRTSYRLEHSYYTNCRTCHGSGVVLSTGEILTRIHRELKNRSRARGLSSDITILCNPEIEEALNDPHEQAYLRKYFRKNIKPEGKETMERSVFSLLG